MQVNQNSSKDSFISWKGELYRKSIHMLSLIMPVSFYIFNRTYIIAGFIILLAFFSVFDLLRMYGNAGTKLFLQKYCGFIIRPRESKSFSGATTIVLAGFLVYLFFEVNIAAAAMVIVVIGDTFAAIIGRAIGRIKYKGKSLEGSLAFIITSALAVLAVPDLSFQVAFAGVVAGAIVEFFTIPIDDNLTIPLTAGVVMRWLGSLS